jgi:catechol-2,3-dioxygenase
MRCSKGQKIVPEVGRQFFSSNQRHHHFAVSMIPQNGTMFKTRTAGRKAKRAISQDEMLGVFNW